MMESMTGGEGRSELMAGDDGKNEEIFQSVITSSKLSSPLPPLLYRSPPISLFNLSLSAVLFHLPERALMMLSLALESPESLWQYQSTDAVSHSELNKRA